MIKTKSKQPDLDRFIENIEKTFWASLNIGKELYNGTRKNTIPWVPCALWFLVINVIFFLGFDILFFKWIGVSKLYLKIEAFSWILYGFLSSLCLIAWAISQINKKRKLTDRLTDVFINSGLKNQVGHLPNFVGDYPIDEYSRKLLLTAEGIPLKSFESQKDHLEANLNVYIDEFRENREKGLIEILYSPIPMPTQINYQDVKKCYNYNYLVGMTRSKAITESFKVSPHLLVAGQSGGGKSTLLRQLITNLYLNHKNVSFKLIDLKEGLEFQTFENLPRIQVVESIDNVINELNNLDTEMNERMEILKKNECKDIDAFQKKIKKTSAESSSSGETINLDRQFIVIDEAAEIFLNNSASSTEDAQKARKVLSRVARLGRACGMHMIVATQRPDVKALDSQVKANLTSIVCFQMPNLPSSMTVLGNGRAAHLPPFPGRAIWKSGSKMIEIQTPFMSEEDAEKLLAPKRVEKTKKETAQASVIQKSPDQRGKV